MVPSLWSLIDVYYLELYDEISVWTLATNFDVWLLGSFSIDKDKERAEVNIRLRLNAQRRYSKHHEDVIIEKMR